MFRDLGPVLGSSFSVFSVVFSLLDFLPDSLARSLAPCFPPPSPSRLSSSLHPLSPAAFPPPSLPPSLNAKSIHPTSLLSLLPLFSPDPIISHSTTCLSPAPPPSFLPPPPPPLQVGKPVDTPRMAKQRLLIERNINEYTLRLLVSYTSVVVFCSCLAGELLFLGQFQEIVLSPVWVHASPSLVPASTAACAVEERMRKLEFVGFSNWSYFSSSCCCMARTGITQASDSTSPRAPRAFNLLSFDHPRGILSHVSVFINSGRPAVVIGVKLPSLISRKSHLTFLGIYRWKILTLEIYREYHFQTCNLGPNSRTDIDSTVPGFCRILMLSREGPVSRIRFFCLRLLGS